MHSSSDIFRYFNHILINIDIFCPEERTENTANMMLVDFKHDEIFT